MNLLFAVKCKSLAMKGGCIGSSDKPVGGSAGTDARRLTYNTAEPSGELSVGDVVAVGEVRLAVGRVGWILVRGGLNEVRTDEHGTHPLPECSRLPDTADRAAIPCPGQGAT